MALHLGNFLGHHLYPRQRPLCLLELQCLGLPYKLLAPVLCYDLDTRRL
jgi:hypothetical protein